MSKTKGNVIDPLDVTEQYGTDAVRFTLAIMAAPGTDIALSEDRMDGYRKFANKIWNAARFLFQSFEKAGIPGWQPPAGDIFRPVAGPDGIVSIEDRWIFSRLSRVAGTMHTAWTEFRFHEAAHEIYHFFWHEFCDWYLELKKLAFEAEGEQQAAAFENFSRVLDIALRLLHPMMPFITEELWQRLALREDSIARAAFPAHDPNLVDGEAERQVALLQKMITESRDFRVQLGVDAGRRIPISFHPRDSTAVLLCRTYESAIKRLANLSELNWRNTSDPGTTLKAEPIPLVPGSAILPSMEMLSDPDPSVSGKSVRSLPEFAIMVDLKEAVDLGAERARLQKKEESLRRELESMRGRMNDSQFTQELPRTSWMLSGGRMMRKTQSILEYVSHIANCFEHHARTSIRSAPGRAN